LLTYDHRQLGHVVAKVRLIAVLIDQPLAHTRQLEPERFVV
jgi:hypothetical protein